MEAAAGQAGRTEKGFPERSLLPLAPVLGEMCTVGGWVACRGGSNIRILLRSPW